MLWFRDYLCKYQFSSRDQRDGEFNWWWVWCKLVKWKKKMKTTVIIAFISIKQYANVPSHGIQQSAKKHAVLRHGALGVCVCVVFSLSSWSDFTSCWYITFHFHFDIHRIMCTKKIYAHRITMRLFIVRKHHQIKSNNLKSHLCGNLLQTLFLLFFRSAFYDSKFYGQHCMHMKKVPRMIKKNCNNQP